MTMLLCIILSRIFHSTVALAGFAQADFTAFEDSGSVSVCIELCDGSTNRPIDLLLYTSDGTALSKCILDQVMSR